PPTARKPGRVDESRERELLHRLEVRALRIRQGRSTVCQPLAQFRGVRLRTEPGKERAGRNAAPDRAQQQRIADVIRDPRESRWSFRLSSRNSITFPLACRNSTPHPPVAASKIASTHQIPRPDQISSRVRPL